MNQPRGPWLIAGASVMVLACSSPSSHEAVRVEVPLPFVDDDSSPTRPPSVPVPAMFIGSGGFGFSAGSAFPGACAPQGLVKAGPDTSGKWGTINFLHYSGYWYNDDTILGFSQMHLHGTGAQDYGVLAFMPIPTFDAARTTAASYASTFEKQSEHASPGFYEVTLANGSIHAEITASIHAAHHRYTFPAAAAQGSVLIDLDSHLSGSIEGAAVKVDAASRTITGHILSKGGMSSGFGGVPISFAIRTRQPWADAVTWSAASPPATGTHAEGTRAGVALSFDRVAHPGPIELQLGISLVSEAQAMANLNAEMPAFDFDGTRGATAAAWRALTDTITFEGATAEEDAMREAALVHAFLMPTVVADTDGTYHGLDGVVRQAAFPFVSDMSLWDTYRTLHPLYTLIAPDRASGAVRSLAAMVEQLGYFPKWPLGTGETGVMLGSSADVVIADAYLRGVRDFDAPALYGKLRSLALDSAEPVSGRGGREYTMLVSSLGFVPASVGRSVSWTVESSQDDYALGNFAEALGHADDAALFRARVGGWTNLFDPASGFLWSKNADGSWATSHGDPSVGTDEFAEADAWQTVVGPWFDSDKLVETFGGSDAFVAKLRELFVQGKADYDATNWRSELSAGSRRGYFWGGNEPDMHAAYLFALAGRPDLTQKWVRWVEDQMFGPGADGLPGNDDGGTMSAWLLFNELGFYPLPGSDRYVIGAPRFPKARIRVSGGTFTVEGIGVSEKAIYVQSVHLDGVPVTKPLIHQSQIRPGGTLSFVMGEKPSTWGR
jgi:predicted alpha-1,2-mannosidase